MKNIFILLSISLIIYTNAIYGRAWNGVMPLVSTRLEAEKILGKSSSTGIEFGFYKYKKSRVIIDYLRKNISDDVNTDVVTRIWIYPTNDIQITSVIEDLSLFRKETGKSDVPGLAFYVNRKEGFSIEVQKPADSKEELVTAFIYYAPEE